MTLRWIPGRQNTGYSKMLIHQGKSWDAYLLRYPVGSYLPRHKDPVPGKRHFRLNVVIRKADDGGKFTCHGPRIFTSLQRISLFRPDLYDHELSPVKSGTRYVFSLGIAI